MKYILSLFIFVSLSVSASAQNNEITFASAKLQEIALQYTGDALNWPILVSLADRNISDNTFTLSQSDITQLQTLAKVTDSVIQQKQRMREQIANGATIFAKNEMISAALSIDAYNAAVKDGNIDEAIELGGVIPSKIDALELAILENRLVEVQAQLENKVGDVNKRAGLLGDWMNAAIGDLFKESDGLRTLAESYANLGFTDGTKVIIDPNTVAVIRKSRVDKLDESTDTEISLVEGGLLAKLSAAAKERSNYILNAGSSETELRTQNFYAESDGNQTVKLTNYDGNANVTANNVTITIRQNEGTIVKEGEPPAAPIKLLPAPELLWSTTDSVVYRDQIVFAFNFVDNADSYILQRSSSSSFDEDLQEIKVSNNAALLSYLELGTTYVRVLAVDRLGLRGPFSEATRIIRNIDNQPPPAFIDNLNGNILFTLNNDIEITGVTQPDARVLINNTAVPVQPSGRFTMLLEDFGVDKNISVVATDDSGNNTVRGVRVVKLTENILFNFALSGATGMNPIRVNRPTVTLSSRAYPGLEVVINNGGNERRVQTDSQGRWGITMSMQQGELSLTFKDIKTGETYLSKSFTVEAN